VPADSCSCHHPLGKPAPPLAKPTLGPSANASVAAITENLLIISLLKRKWTAFCRNAIDPTLYDIFVVFLRMSTRNGRLRYFGHSVTGFSEKGLK
jgi:hypothetical protein